MEREENPTHILLRAEVKESKEEVGIGFQVSGAGRGLNACV